MNYEEILKRKRKKIKPIGFYVERDQLNENLFPFQRDIVQWALKKGRSALFEDTGLGKTLQSLSWSEEVHKYTEAPVLILAPLAVAKQTVKEGLKFGVDVHYVSDDSQVKNGINITNYERIHLFDTDVFSGVVLDESSILKSYTGKTTNDLIDRFADTKFKLCCTATPSPNDYTEIGTTAEFLGVKKRNEMLAEYFINDVSNGVGWRLKGHSEQDFFEWIGSWGMFIKNPESLGYDGSGYKLPSLNIETAIIESKPDVGMLLVEYAETLQERREARKESMNKRVQKAVEIINSKPDENFLVWCDFNDESTALYRAIENSVEVKGSDKPEHKEKTLMGFADGTVKYLVSKPKIAGWGMNWQNCNNMIFCGLSDSFESFYQAVRRCYRFGQKKEVNVYVIISEKEMNVLKNIQEKQAKHDEMTENMQKIMSKIINSELRGKEYEPDLYNPTQKMILL